MTITHNGEEYGVIISQGLDGMDDIIKLRTEVFVEEQGFENEFDDTDNIAAHCLLTKNGLPAATGRAYVSDGIMHIGRIAVVKSMRGMGLGSAVLRVLEGYARDQGHEKTALSAQCRVKGFYEANGYHAEGNIYYDEYCPHIMMYKDL